MAKYLTRVILVSLVCMVFTAVNNCNIGIISQLAAQNDNDWIGPLSMGLIFLGSGLGAFYNKYIRKHPFNKIIFVGALGWDGYICLSVLFLFIGFSSWVNSVIVIGSLVCGVTVSLFYNGFFNYVNQCGIRDNSIEKYFGISLCINQSANLLGGGFSALLVEPLGQQNYSILMLVISVCCTISFVFMKQFEGRLKKDEKSQVLSLIEQDLDQNEDILVLQVKRKVPWILFFSFGFSGVMINFIFGQISLLFYQYYDYMEKQQLNHLTFIALMIEGSGQSLGGLALALFSKKIKNISAAYTLNGLAFLIALIIFFLGLQNDLIYLIYISSFIVGFVDCFGFSLAASIGGFWKESGISLFSAGQSVTVALLSVPTIFFQFPIMFCIYVFIFFLSCLGLWKNRRLIQQIQQECSQA